MGVSANQGKGVQGFGEMELESRKTEILKLVKDGKDLMEE